MPLRERLEIGSERGETVLEEEWTRLHGVARMREGARGDAVVVVDDVPFVGERERAVVAGVDDGDGVRRHTHGPDAIVEHGAVGVDRDDPLARRPGPAAGGHHAEPFTAR